VLLRARHLFCPVPNESSLHHPLLFLFRFILILSSLFNVVMLTRQFCIKPRAWKVVSAATLHVTAEYTVSSMKGPVLATINRSSRFPVVGAQAHFLYLFLRSLQSVRRHSAVVVTGTVNDMQEIYPVKHLTCKLNRR
jgi:hypothetical protein